MQIRPNFTRMHINRHVYVNTGAAYNRHTVPILFYFIPLYFMFVWISRSIIADLVSLSRSWPCQLCHIHFTIQLYYQIKLAVPKKKREEIGSANLFLIYKIWLCQTHFVREGQALTTFIICCCSCTVHN